MKQLTITLALLLGVLGIRAQAKFDYFYLEAEKCRLEENLSSALDLYRHCLNINPEAPEALYHMGLLQLYLHSDSVGTELVRKACERDSANPYYLETLAALYLGKHDATSAIPVLERMAVLQTGRSDVLSQLVQLYADMGETDKAIGALERIEVLEGKSPQVSIEKFRLYKEKGNLDSAFFQLQELCDDAPHDMNLRVFVATQYMHAGDTLRALRILDDVRRREPDNTNLQLATMDYLRDCGQDERYNSLRDSLLFLPDSPSSLRTLLIKSYVSDVQRDSAYAPRLAAAFDTLLSRPQQNAELLILKAAYQTYRKQPQEDIMQTMRQILDVEPGNETALMELMKHYVGKHDWHGVEETCRMGQNYHPEELSYAFYLGLALFDRKRLDEAAQTIRQGLLVRDEGMHPYFVSDAFSVLGDIFHEMGREQEAFAAYDSALVYRDDNISCLNNYAYFLSLHNEQLDRAEEMSYRTIRKEPENVVYLDTYAWILFMKQDYANARTYMDKVVNPEKSDAELLADENLQGNLLEHAGDIYSLLGEQATALRLWKLARQKDDDTCSPLLRKKIRHKKYIR